MLGLEGLPGREGWETVHWGEVWALYPELFAVAVSLAPLPWPLPPLPWHSTYVHMPLLLVLLLMHWVMCLGDQV